MTKEELMARAATAAKAEKEMMDNTLMVDVQCTIATDVADKVSAETAKAFGFNEFKYLSSLMNEFTRPEKIASAMTEIVPSTYTYNSDLTIGDYSPIGNFYEISNLSSEAEVGRLIRNESRYEIDNMLKILWEIFDISPADLGFKNYEFVVDWSEVKE